MRIELNEYSFGRNLAKLLIVAVAPAICGCANKQVEEPGYVRENGVPHETIVARAKEELAFKTSAHEALFKIGTAVWELDQDKGIIKFTSSDGIVATASAQIIGTYNTKDKTWLWGWDNPSVDSKLAAHSKIVREYGEKRGIPELTKSQLSISEDQCWELTALACKLGRDQGAYKGPSGDTKVFMTFGEVMMQKKR